MEVITSSQQPQRSVERRVVRGAFIDRLCIRTAGNEHEGENREKQRVMASICDPNVLLPRAVDSLPLKGKNLA